HQPRTRRPAAGSTASISHVPPNGTTLIDFLVGERYLGNYGYASAAALNPLFVLSVLFVLSRSPTQSTWSAPDTPAHHPVNSMDSPGFSSSHAPIGKSN